MISHWRATFTIHDQDTNEKQIVVLTEVELPGRNEFVIRVDGIEVDRSTDAKKAMDKVLAMTGWD